MVEIRRPLLLVGIIGILFTSFLMFQYLLFSFRPITLKEVTVTIEPGTPVRPFLLSLNQDEGVKPFGLFWFEVFIRLSGEGKKMQAGEYAFAPNQSGRDIIQKVIKGKVVQHSLTLIDGWTAQNVLNEIKEHPAVRITLNLHDNKELLKQLGLSEPSLEGLFFPETYHFPRGTTDKEILLRAYELMQSKLKQAWSIKSPDLPIQTPYQALIMASLIEKESGLTSEWPLIAQVFYNRLQKNMRLQSDPTVIFGLGDQYTGKISKKDLKHKSSYNTYVIDGLPPTPIAIPNFGAILAACRPASGAYLYFVAQSDGTHAFSQTLEEHHNKVKQYLRTKQDGSS